MGYTSTVGAALTQPELGRMKPKLTNPESPDFSRGECQILSMLTYNPKILFYDFLFFFPENVLALLGFFLFLYSLIYLYRKRNGLVKTGPYKYVRHPQYLGIIMMTFGLTLVSLQIYPVIPYLLTPIYIGHLAVLLVWTVEVFAYIILAKLEESYLRSKFGDEYVKYSESVPFIIPLRLKSDTKK